jgi:hypothetical protein
VVHDVVRRIFDRQPCAQGDKLCVGTRVRIDPCGGFAQHGGCAGERHVDRTQMREAMCIARHVRWCTLARAAPQSCDLFRPQRESIRKCLCSPRLF